MSDERTHDPERCPALQHDESGAGGPPHRCVLPAGHDGLHDAIVRPAAVSAQEEPQ